MKFKLLVDYKLAKEYKADGLAILETIPWSMIAHAEEQAFKNHSQSLTTLNRRGGLSPSEAVAVIKGLPWRSISQTMTEAQCMEWLRVESQKYV
jgi:hypothetical protein